MKGTCGSDAGSGIIAPTLHGRGQGGVDGDFPLGFPLDLRVKEARAHLSACTGTKEQTSRLT